jgi:uroporphyrinogen III methyltransferase/synthase
MPADAASATDARPLRGKRIVITRARAQAAGLAQAIEQLGGEVVEFPTIEIRPVADLRALDDALNSLAGYDWLMFTSVNGVDMFFQRLARSGTDHRKLDHLRFAAIGPETASRLAAAGVRNCLVPGSYRAEGILEMLEPGEFRGKRVLIPRAAKAREVLPETLRAWGALVDVVEIYRAVLPDTDPGELAGALERRNIDMVTFTSSSTVENFVRLFSGRPLAEILNGTAVAAIGPITEKTIAKLGGVAHVTAGEFTISGLVRAMTVYFSEQRPQADP